tara:strand:- start:47 stop:1036 length:990 start_codon:yes stop_codon:yes gene_type:complete
MKLEKFLELQYKDKKNNLNYNSNNLIQIFNLLSISAIEISKIISNPEQSELSNKSGATNSDGDETKNLDLKAESIIRQNLSSTDIKWYASEEEKDFVFLNKNGSFSICIDPLDGSSNIETNAPIGTIFGVFKSKKTPNETILQSGDNLLASGFFIYGPRVKLIFSVGNGTSIFQLNQTDEFVLMQEMIKIPEYTNELSINFSNYAFWPSYIKSYVEECISLYKYNNQSNYNMRWIGSLVADCYRILIRGGIFLYPQDTRKGYERGRLRLVYEANPVAFLIEQSGAFATDGQKRILSLKPKSIHERVPFIFGSKNEKNKLLEFYGKINVR